MDWDKDGKLDIISGTYMSSGKDGAYTQFLKGKGGLQFDFAKHLMTETGKPLLLPTPAEDPDKLYRYTNICTQHALEDLTGDGQRDMIIGGFGGYLIQFDGTAGKGINRFLDNGRHLKDQQGKLLQVPSGKANPQLVDWDNDGDLDFISGSSSGAVFFSENIGSKTAAKWETFKMLVPPAKAPIHQDSKDVVRAKNARVVIWDYNNDGLLDIILGDRTVVHSPKRPGLEKRVPDFVKKHTAMAKRAKELQFDESLPKQERGKKASKAMLAAYKYGTKYLKYSSTGHIWVFLQKK